jgi:Cyclin, N-terminal domain/Cyclin, C-terminal domain
MLDKVRELAKKFKQRPESLFTAVDYMDFFVCSSQKQDDGITCKKRQALVVVTSLLMGSKVEELDEYIPYIKHLLKYYSLHLENSVNVPSLEEIIEFEREMCFSFNWNLSRINTNSFL